MSNLIHQIPPVYDSNSKVLILGSFPSVKSREQSFFYAHPQNRFWRVVSAVYSVPTPVTVEEKRSFLLSFNIALWDVISSCTVVGSSDSSIKNVVVNDLSVILNNSKIEHIFVNGKTAEKYYNKYLRPILLRDAECLPSTSAANAAWSINDLVDAWRVIKK